MAEQVRDLVCIVCPKGCRLRIEQTDDGLQVSGNHCARGAEYAQTELTHPTRVLTSTVRITGALHARLPVKSSCPIPRELLAEAVRLLNGVVAVSPILAGDVLLADILGTGADIVATRDM